MSEEKLPDSLTVETGDRKWVLKSPGFQIRLEAEDEVRKQRRIEFRNVMLTLAEIPEENKNRAMVMAFDGLLRNVFVSTQESSDWLTSAAGELFQIRKALQAADPTVTIEQAYEFLGLITVQQNTDIFMFLSGKLLGK